MTTEELFRQFEKYLHDFLVMEKTGRIVLTIDCRYGGIAKVSMTVTHEFNKSENNCCHEMENKL